MTQLNLKALSASFKPDISKATENIKATVNIYLYHEAK